jgi:predicted transposase/invertase (TIGR01784 family)
LKVNNFNKVAVNTLDEWIYFLKNSEVKDEFHAKGLDKVKQKLKYEDLSDEDKKMYLRSVENKRIQMSVEYTARLEAKLEAKQEVRQEVKQEVEQESKIKIAKNMLADKEPNEKIAKYTGLTLEQIETLRKETKE